MPNKRDVPGNSIESARLYQQQMVRMAEQLMRFTLAAERAWEGDVWLRGCSVRFPDGVRGEYLLIARADTPEGAVVAFVSSDEFADTVRKFVASLENGSLKWKEDKYANS